MKAKIMVADDERLVRENVSAALTAERYEVVSFPDGASAWEAARTGSFDLAILDISMPLLEGTALLSRIKAARLGLPVIFLTSRDEEIDRIAGLESGADDYVSKPFSLGELLARVRAVLRRTAPPESAEPRPERAVAVGIALDAEGSRAFWDGEELRLTLTEYRMLARLASRPSALVSRATLMREAFPLDSYVSERSADSHVKRLRRKLESAGAPEGIIEAVYGGGYRLRLSK